MMYQPNLFQNQFQPQQQLNPYMNMQQNMQQNLVQNYNKTQFFVKQVSSIDEAKSFIIDAFSTYLFVDYNSGKIYFKKMNNNGGADFFTFAVEEPKQEVDPFVEINQRLSNIETKIGGFNVQSISNAESQQYDSATDDSANAKTKSTGLSESTGNDSRKK